MRKENLEYFYKIQSFRPKATKHVIKSDFLIFSGYSQILQFLRRWTHFSDLMHVCVNQKNYCSYL